MTKTEALDKISENIEGLLTIKSKPVAMLLLARCHDIMDRMNREGYKDKKDIIEMGELIVKALMRL